ncbi:MAG TPA: hypothetical protein VHZ51_03760 [Ktedonobacteraceae bacterium]|nr:hypothetical protein [Ktedonobacteraceae bacterium]
MILPIVPGNRDGLGVGILPLHMPQEIEQFRNDEGRALPGNDRSGVDIDAAGNSPSGIGAGKLARLGSSLPNPPVDAAQTRTSIIGDLILKEKREPLWLRMRKGLGLSDHGHLDDHSTDPGNGPGRVRASSECVSVSSAGAVLVQSWCSPGKLIRHSPERSPSTERIARMLHKLQREKGNP